MAQESKKKNLGLYDSRPVRWRTNQGAFCKLGGFTVYSETEQKLRDGIERLSTMILEAAESNLILTSKLIRSLVQQRFDSEIPKRTFSVVIGRQLHLGQLDSIVCEGSQGNPFRAILHSARLAELEELLFQMVVQLRDDGAIGVAQIRDANFADNEEEYGWAQAVFVAARIVQRGYAVYVDKHNIKLPKALEDAGMRPHNVIGPPNG